MIRNFFKIGLVSLLAITSSMMYVAMAQIAPLNGAMTTNSNTLSSNNVMTYWSYCFDDPQDDDNLSHAVYVGQGIQPKFGYEYYNLNAQRVKAVLNSTQMLIYNPGSFASNGTFSYLSNLNPNLNAPNRYDVKVTQMQNPVAAINNTVGRANIAAMYVLDGDYLTYSKGSSINNSPYGWRTTYTQATANPFNFTLTNPATPTQHRSCNQYYVAKCGDGVVDNPNKPGGSNTDGKQGISTVNGFVPRSNSNFPYETCDDGANNGQPGYCNNSCNGEVSLPNPVCTSISLTPNSLTPGQSTNIVCNGTNATSYSISVNGPGNPFNYTLGNSVNYTPTIPGNYTVSCTVFGAQGTTPSTCSTQTLSVVDTSPVCENFTVNPQTVAVGQPVTLFCDGNQYSNAYQILVMNQANSLVSSFNGGLPAPSNSVTTTWTPNAPGTYTTQCAVSNNNTQVDYCANQIIVVGQPNLWVNKVANQSGVAQGGTISFTISFGNSGNVVATNVNIEDILPSGLQYVSHTIVGVSGGTPFNQQTPFGYSVGFSGLTLQPGQSGTMTITTTYVSPTCEGGIINYVTIYNQENQSNNTATFDCIPAASASVAIDKKQHVTGSPTDAIISVFSGDIITYTMVVTNTGGSTQNNIYLEDILPPDTSYISSTISGLPGLTSSHTAGIVSSNVFNLAPGQTVTWVITASINISLGSFLNTAYVKAVGGAILAQDSVLAVCGGVGPTPNPALTLDKSIINQQPYYLPGDTIVYQIVFSNVGSGAAYDVVIQDILPQAVTYVSSSISPNLGTFSQSTQGGSHVISYGGFTLNPGQTVTVLITGVVNSNINNNTLNTAILQSSNHPTLTDTADFGSQAIPYIQKYQKTTGLFTQSQITVNIGDTIMYKVVVRNIGGSVATGVIISDTLPLGISYVSSTLDVPFGNTTTTTTVSGQTVISYQGITLNPGQQATLLITAQVMASSYTSYTNVGQVQFFNPYQVLTSSVVAIRLPTAQVLFTKQITTTQTVYAPGDTVGFSLQFVNNGPATVTNIVVQDIWPSCLQFGSWTSNPSLTQTSNSNPYARSYPSLAAGQSITLHLTGTVINNPNCTGIHTNTGIVTYTLGNNQYTLQSTATFQVVIPDPAQCINLTTTTSSILLNPGQSNGSAQLTCTASQASNMRIDCGNGTSSQTVFGSSLTHTCNYSQSNVGQTFTAKCIVDDATTIPNSCQKPITITQGSFNICGNGIKEGYEQCDLPNGTTIGAYLDNGFTPTPAILQGAGHYCENCAIKGGSTSYEPPACFYTNTTISAQRGEILPFRWSLDQSSNTNITPGNTCTQANSIPRGTMMCTFSFYAPNELNPGSHVGQFTTPCFGNNRSNDIYYNFFTTAFPDAQNAFGRYQWQIPSNLQKFGEYKITLESVEYEYCNENLQFIPNPQQVDRVCEVNFALTRPYLVQKSAFSNVPQTTTIDIGDFYAMNGTSIKDMTDLSEIMVLDASTYAINPNTNLLLHDFVSQYKQLAVTVNEPAINALFANASQIQVSKVPGKQIYIFESLGADRITLREMQGFSAPFTMIVDGMDLVVQGSITNTNGMFLVKGGKVSFQEPSTNACATRQVVNGVFITDQGFGIDDPDLLINNALGTARCNEGGLTVKGVLIGQNINALVAQRRSHLNTWFHITSTNEAGKRAERRNKIFDGAAVLIEYNPALRQNLPPGMNEFTQVLDVYKQ